MLYLVWVMLLGFDFLVCAADVVVMLGVVLLLEFWFVMWVLVWVLFVLRIDYCCVGFVLLVCDGLLLICK